MKIQKSLLKEINEIYHSYFCFYLIICSSLKDSSSIAGTIYRHEPHTDPKLHALQICSVKETVLPLRIKQKAKCQYANRDVHIKIKEFQFFPKFQMLEIIGNENVNLSEKQMAELIELLDKEEILEVESKIQKALDKAAIAAKEQDKPSDSGGKVMYPYNSIPNSN